MRIYKGHDVSWYDNHSELNLEDFGIPKGAFVVACTANMRPVKGVPYLIQAIETIPFEENVHLLLIGKVQDHEIEKLLLRPQHAERIHLAGFRKDATSVVSKCDVFVMPSVAREGLAKALMEAMSVRVAPIVSNVGGLPEVVLDGINGFVVPPRDAKSLADGILKLKHDESLRRQFAVASRKRVENDFNVQQTILET
ncbi:MAG: glycosyltransferase family 4 protein, partial [SAR324 cluster bacterium]|nr:glycosyltransferase family 4 protein [SAR324 cluster bacterium]